MKNLYCLIISIIFCHAISASDTTIKSLNLLNRSKIGNPPLNKDCNPNNGDDELFLKCATDLCGSPKINPTASLTDVDFDQYVSPDVMKRFAEIEKEVIEIVKAKKKKNDRLITGFENLKSKGNDKIDFSNFKNWEYQNYSNDVYRKYVKCEIDKKQEFQKRLKVTVKYPKNATELFKKALDAYAKRKEEKIKNNLSTAIYEQFYTMDEAKKKLEDAWANLYRTFSEELIKNPDFMKENQSSLESIKEKKEKIESGKYKDIWDLGSVASDLENISNAINYAQTGAWPETSKYDECQDEECKKGIQEFIGSLNLSDLYKKLKEKNNESNLIPERVMYCKSELAMRGIEDYDTQQFQNLMPIIIKNFLNNVFKKFSSESRKIFEQYLSDELNLSFKPMGKETVDEFIKEVHNEYEAFQENNKGNDEQTTDIKYYLSQIFSLKEGNEIIPLKYVNICQNNSFVAWDEFEPKEMLDEKEEIPDDADPNKDNLFISKFSCSHINHGKGIISHEIGHALSWEFLNKKLSVESYGKFMKLRECANNLYKDGGIDDVAIEDFSHKDDKYRTEEDTADLISFLANPDKNTLFSCSLLDPTLDGKSYRDVTLNNKEDFDPHSSPLLRLLQEVLHKKVSIPSSCKEVIEKYKDIYRFELCY